MSVLIAIGTTDFDPTEVAIPWKILREAGQEVRFATDTGHAGETDPRMLYGDGLGIFKGMLAARKNARQTYLRLCQEPAFLNPIRFEDIKPEDYDGLILPGGHAKGMIPYLESEILQEKITAFFAADKPIGAICHGVVAACRAKDPQTGKSVLYGRKTTALLNRQELLAHKLTKARLGDYFLTYPGLTVEDEVTAALQSADDFLHGPTPLLRDTPKKLSRGFVVQDGQYLSARWPGDAHRFGQAFADMIMAKAA
ncbi:MAG: type 1 glutamine amidotransferase domain-containing protein [Robiginitomaculum sp.]|nr:type 1 glutamine amidotransferase domain-containing protein [Robiginitomaculum sp.]MDQ7077741.1 type 1 glutamine amidotransferase domain-containing protein [Robiginitomaculum sp.]